MDGSLHRINEARLNELIKGKLRASWLAYSMPLSQLSHCALLLRRSRNSTATYRREICLNFERSGLRCSCLESFRTSRFDSTTSSETLSWIQLLAVCCCQSCLSSGHRECTCMHTFKDRSTRNLLTFLDMLTSSLAMTIHFWWLSMMICLFCSATIRLWFYNIMYFSLNCLTTLMSSLFSFYSTVALPSDIPPPPKLS